MRSGGDNIGGMAIPKNIFYDKLNGYDYDAYNSSPYDKFGVYDDTYNKIMGNSNSRIKDDSLVYKDKGSYTFKMAYSVMIGSSGDNEVYRIFRDAWAGGNLRDIYGKSVGVVMGGVYEFYNKYQSDVSTAYGIHGTYIRLLGFDLMKYSLPLSGCSGSPLLLGVEGGSADVLGNMKQYGGNFYLVGDADVDDIGDGRYISGFEVYSLRYKHEGREDIIYSI